MTSLTKYILILITLFALTWCSSNAPETIDTKTIEENAKVVLDQAEPALELRTIYALWDSLTAWYLLPSEDSYPAQLEDILQKKWYNVKVLNWWISWDTSKWLAQRLDWQLEWAKTDDIALLVIWANDGLRGMPLDQLHNNITEISQKILDTWLFLIVWWMQLPLNNSPEYRSEFEDVYKDLCDEYKEDLRVSCIPFFLESVWWVPELNLPDGIHPTKQWYSIVVDNLLPYVEEILSN